MTAIDEGRIMTAGTDPAEDLCNALVRTMRRYATRHDIGPENCCIAALALVGSCLGAFEHEENRKDAVTRVIKALPMILGDDPDTGLAVIYAGMAVLERHYGPERPVN